jgi:hypothetical protein
MRRLLFYGVLVSILMSFAFSGCEQAREATKEQFQAGILQPSSSFSPIPGKGWQEIAVFEGQIGKQTAVFNIPDRRWRISWQATIPQREMGTFSIEIYRENGLLFKELYKEILYSQTSQGSYSETADFTEGKGNFYLRTGTRNINFWRIGIDTSSPPTLAQLSDQYPYSATIPPELAGKIEVIYSCAVAPATSPSDVTTYHIEFAVKNNTNQRMSDIWFGYDILDQNGNVLAHSPRACGFPSGPEPGEVLTGFGCGGSEPATASGGIWKTSSLQFKVFVVSASF